MQKNKIVFGIFAIVIWTLSACKGYTSPVPKIANPITNECIRPIFNIAVPKIENMPGSEVHLQKIPPKGTWEMVANSPVPTETEIEMVANNNGLWISSPPVKKLYYYNIQKNTWRTYDKVGGLAGYPSSLFVSSDGVLWGYNIKPIDSDDTNKLPLISYYNSITDEFESISDIDGNFNQVTSVQSNFVEDDKGVLWAFMLERERVALYSFDPANLHTKRYFSLDKGGHHFSLAISPKGNIWYVNTSSGYLTQFIPSANKIEAFIEYPNVDDLEEMGSAFYLYFDDQERLWLDNTGWLDFTDPQKPTWNNIIPSSAFITEFSNYDTLPRDKYGFAKAYKNYQSSNGWYWFTSAAGIVRLDMEKEEWCLVSTGRSPVIEDNEGNIWIAVLGKLYKYHLPK